MNSLFAYLAKYGPVPAADQAFLIENATLREVARHQVVLPAGSVCRHMYFLESGLARFCYLKAGKDITTRFYGPGMPMTALASLLHREPSLYTLETVEPTRLYALSYEKLMRLLARSHAFEHISRLAALDILLDNEKWLHTQRFQSAQERYESFLTMYPALAPRVPLTHVASYLGITLETLSRIRAATGRI